MFHPRGPTFLELAHQALSSTRRGYDLLAPKFEHTPFLTPPAVIDAVFEHLTSLGPFRRGLDLCCGTGATFEGLDRCCAEEVLGVDFSLGMLMVNRDFHPPVEGGPKRYLLCADVRTQPLPERYDLAVSFGAFGHFVGADQETLVSRIYNALKPGGVFVFVTSDPPGGLFPGRWLSVFFNLAIGLRNLFRRPPFVMYYLTFLLPRAEELLRDAGFGLEVVRGFCPAHPRLVLVQATKRKKTGA